MEYNLNRLRNTLVTGGAGFIGSALIRTLLKNDKINVLNIDKLTYAGNLESLSEYINKSSYSHELIDINNKDLLDKAFNYFRPTCVMHLAAESHVDRSIDGPSEFIKTNVLGTFNLLESTRKYFNSLDKESKKEFRFHHISTDEVYGDLEDSKEYFTESSNYSPSSPYSASKASSDHLVRSWGRTYGLPVLITNCSNNYGPYHFPEKFIPHIILNALEGKSLPIYGDGSNIRDWLYVEDHAEALIRVISNGRVGETYNIGGNSEKTNLEVVNTICQILEELVPQKPNGLSKYDDLISFVDDRPGHDKRYAVDSSKIKNDLNWAPSETFETGMRKTIKWYLDNKVWWSKILSGDYKLSRLGKGNDISI